MSYFSTKQPVLILSYGIDVEESQKIDKFLSLIERSGALNLLEKHDTKRSKEDDETEKDKGGRPQYNRYDLFATILFCFAFGTGSLRDIEEQCKYDLRLMYLMSNEFPKHSVIGKFINDFVLPNADQIFSLITNEIIKECKIDVSDAFADGSKYEALSNKRKFVWKPITFHLKLAPKVIDLLVPFHLERGISEKELISSKTIANKITQLSKIQNTEKTIELLTEILAKCLEYEEKERICGPDRNSYYKTDPDATAMCLKSDYYSGLGSNMHAAYNVQLLVSKGLILSYLLSQSRNDLKDLIPLLDKHYHYYSWNPKNLAADSGYGSEENYRYLEEKKIGNYVKYFTWEGNVSGRNPSCYRLNEDGTITCLNSKIGKKVEIENRHPKKANAVFYKVTGCKKCEFSSYCKRFMKNKNENHKIFEVCVELQQYIQQAETNLLSPKGIEMRVNRSAQVEGAFGVIKRDINYERFRRTSMEKVNLEFMLVSLGYNIRKLFRFYDGKSKFKYWQAPDNLEAEKMKKPSAKRLANKVNKKKTKSVNERSKDYKYK